MSLVVVDAGNTSTRLAIADAGGLRHIAVLPTSGLVVDQLPSAAELVGASSVRMAAVGGVGDLLESWSATVLGVPCERLESPRNGDGLINAYGDASQQLGVDRFLAMLAARLRVSGPVLVVDAGTALTLDAVDARGQHLGGFIVPGLGMARSSLRDGTDALPEVEGSADLDLGTDTETAILGGTLAQQVALIRSVLAELATDTTLVITGGDAERLIPFLGADLIHSPDLVLEGLANCQPSGWVR
jgi:type III pantothenate kinase